MKLDWGGPFRGPNEQARTLLRKTPRVLFLVLTLPLCFANALAVSPDRDKAWDALVAQARKHGGEPTTYKESQSFVFQRLDGTYVTLTRMTDTNVRAVCLIAKDQNGSVCGNWDSKEIRYGWRADANSPWTYSASPPPAAEPTLMAKMLANLADLIEMGTKTKRPHFWANKAH